MFLFDTHRSVGRRLRLATSRDLGAGNFFWHACRTAPDLDTPILFHQPGAGGEARPYSLSDLRSTVSRYVNWYADQGVGPASTVGVYTGHGLRGLLHHIAITSLGAVDALANPKMAPAVAADYFRRCGAMMIVGDAELITACAADLPETLPVVSVDAIDRAAGPVTRPLTAAPYRHRPDDLVLISHSSGTTGRPKPATFTHRGFFVGKRERLWNFPSRRSDRMLSALPHSHSAGISYLSLALLLGLPTLMLDDRSGSAVAAAMNEFHPSIVLGFPLSLAELPIAELSAEARRAVQTWMGMGDASHERHIRPLVQLGRTRVGRGEWRDGSTYIDGLGSSEMGMVLFKNPHTKETSHYRRMIGRPVPVVRQAEALDENGRPVAPQQVGLLGVRTPSVTPGYWDDPELTDRYRAGGYFLTGDVVRRDADGNWYHVDRTPDVISTVDGPVYSLPLEEVLLNTTGALDAAVVAADDPDGPGASRPIGIVLFDGAPPAGTEEELLARCNAELEREGLASLRALIIAADRDELPVGVTGKVLKRVLRERHRTLLQRNPQGVDNGAARTIVDIATGPWRAQALHAAVAFRLPDHVAAGHTTATALAARANANEDGIARLMHLLTAMDVFAGNARDGYRLTGIGELLRTEVAGSMRDMCELYGNEFYQAWGSFVPAIATGHTGFKHAFGVELRDHLAEQPGASVKFQRAMNAGSVFFADVPKAYDFSHCATVVDVAGGNGTLLAAVLAANPSAHGVLFDLPHTVPAARQHLQDAVGADRFDVVAGDVFEAVPSGADAYLLSRVLQDWPDSSAVKLLTNCRSAMPDSARLLVLERVIPDGGPELLPLLWDLHLLTMAGGRERTLDGYRSVLADAGLRLESVHPLALETSLLVAAPA